MHYIEFAQLLVIDNLYSPYNGSIIHNYSFVYMTHSATDAVAYEWCHWYFCCWWWQSAKEKSKQLHPFAEYLNDACTIEQKAIYANDGAWPAIVGWKGTQMGAVDHPRRRQMQFAGPKWKANRRQTAIRSRIGAGKQLNSAAGTNIVFGRWGEHLVKRIVFGVDAL